MATPTLCKGCKTTHDPLRPCPRRVTLPPAEVGKVVVVHGGESGAIVSPPAGQRWRLDDDGVVIKSEPYTLIKRDKSKWNAYMRDYRRRKSADKKLKEGQ